MKKFYTNKQFNNLTEAFQTIRDRRNREEDIQDAYTFIYHMIRSRVIYTVSREYFRNDLSLAEDALQNACISLFPLISSGHFNNVRGIYAWVRKSCFFYAMDWFQYKKLNDSDNNPHTTITSLEQLSADGEAFELINQIEDHRFVRPEEYALQKSTTEELYLHIRKAITNETQRLVFTMHFVDSKKEREIADALNMNINTVKSNLRYAKKALSVYRSEFEKSYNLEMNLR